MFSMLPSLQGHTIISDETDDSTLLDEQVQDILFSKFPMDDIRQVTLRFQDLDPLKNFYIIKELDRELGFVKLENIVLENFMEKNDPKFLVGVNESLKQHEKSERTGPKIQFIGKETSDRSAQSQGKSGSVRSIPRTQQSQILGRSSTASFQTIYSIKPTTDWRLNYNIKSEITEKLFMELRKEFDKIKQAAITEMKSIRAHIEELNYCNAETKGTLESFQEVVINVGFDPLTGDIPAEKFIKYFVNWIKNAMALISTLRLKIQTLHEHCHQLKIMIIRKSDLNGMLGPADFEQMKIKKEEFTIDLEDHNTQLIKIKKIAGKASSALAAQRKVLQQIELNSKQINIKINDCTESSEKIDHESNIVSKEITDVKRNIKILEEKMEKYEAPTVTEYIQQKSKLSQLEKEEKLLGRQIGILKLKLKNSKIKFKKQK